MRSVWRAPAKAQKLCRGFGRQQKVDPYIILARPDELPVATSRFCGPSLGARDPLLPQEVAAVEESTGSGGTPNKPLCRFDFAGSSRADAAAAGNVFGVVVAIFVVVPTATARCLAFWEEECYLAHCAVLQVTPLPSVESFFGARRVAAASAITYLQMTCMSHVRKQQYRSEAGR